MSKPSMNKKMKKTGGKTNNQDDTRNLADGEFVAIVTKKLGNLMFELRDIENNSYKAKLKSSLKRKFRVAIGNIVIAESILNLYEIVHIYSETKEKELKTQFSKEVLDITSVTSGLDSIDFEGKDEIDIDAI